MLVSSLVKEVLAILLDLPFVLCIDFGWVCNSAGFEVRVDKLVCNLGRVVSYPISAVEIRMQLPLLRTA